MKDKILIYGVTGYTGALIARTALKQGLQPVIAGRNPAKLKTLAEEWQVEARVFSLDNTVATEKALADVKVVLNCAGPFAQTVEPLATACVKTGTHYLDIAGEVKEFQAVAALDQAARSAGTMLMPGGGFGVVPTDCLAVYLAEQLPDAQELTLAFQTIGGASRGTVITILSDIHKAGVVRRNGSLQPAFAAQKSRQIDFGNGAVKTVSNPWRADLVTAFYSTKIPNIETYSAFPSALQILMKIGRYLGFVLNARWFKNFLQNSLKNQPEGPSEQARASGKAFVWGEVRNVTGQTKTACWETPEAYEATALTAVAILHKVLQDKIKLGFQTPGQLYGADFVLELPGFSRTATDKISKVKA